MTYKHILYKHVKVHMTGNYSEWVQGMMEHHRVQKNPKDDTPAAAAACMRVRVCEANSYTHVRTPNTF